jgi:flavin reductase (DIM6/NTAB) family NADH-FMN oxidoreductase RutF
MAGTSHIDNRSEASIRVAADSPGGGAQHGSPAASADAFRGLMSRFPTGVCVVTTVDTAGCPRGLTCSSLSSVTLHPPTLLVCLSTGSRTLAALREHGYFAVNLLHSRAQRVAEVFSSPHPDRFSLVRWRASGSAGLPWLVDDAFAFADCRVCDMRIVGDHAVVFGRVTAISHHRDVPLLYGLRQFLRLASGQGQRRQ